MSAPIPLAGVIGMPIAHSRSPRLHGHWLRHYGLAGHYIPMAVETDDLKEVLRTLPKAGFRGVNVTLPHKERALALADSVTDRAASIGAANTLTFDGGKIMADNTDAYGFSANLAQGAPDWSASDGPAAVIGAGGAARAILFALLEGGAPEIRLSNRTEERAAALAQEFGPRIKIVPWHARRDALAGAATVVNTSSLGMSGAPDLDLPLDHLSANAVVTDIVYTPLETDLLKRARAMGCISVDGLGMLLHQAVPGFEAWFGCRPEVTDDLRKAVLAP